MFRKDWKSKFLREAADLGGQTPAPEPQIEAPAGPDLSFIPADFHTDGKPDLAKFQEHYKQVTTPAQPKAPEAYEFKIPEGIKYEGLDLPEGFTVNLDTENPAMAPLFTELGGFLKEMDAPPEASQKVMGLLARYEATHQANIQAAHKAEMVKLGTNASERVANLERALATKLPAEQAKAITGLTQTAAAVMALEKLLSGGAFVPPSQNRTDPAGVEADLKSYYANPTR